MTAKRLSKEECSNIAIKMTKEIQNEINAISEWFNNLNRQLLEKKVPETIMSIFSGDSDLAKYIKTTDYGYLNFSNRGLYTSFESIPSNNSNRVTLAVPEKYIGKANLMYDKKNALETKKRLLIKELEDVLYKLSTPKRITEHLPEALSFLPKVEEHALPQINLTQFRQKLKEELGEIK